MYSNILQQKAKQLSKTVSGSPRAKQIIKVKSVSFSTNSFVKNTKEIKKVG